MSEGIHKAIKVRGRENRCEAGEWDLGIRTGWR